MTDRWLAAFLSDSLHLQDKSDKTRQNRVSSPSVAFVPGTERITNLIEARRREADDLRRRAARALSAEALADPAELTIRGELE